jgi:NitT/TauT family transport system ATP-binding protein
MNKMISVKDLTKSFDGTKVLDSFCADISENTAIMGASGKGKTTLVRLICGLDKDFDGKIEFSFSPKISVVFQQDRLFDGFSAIENVTAVTGGRFDKDSVARATEILTSLLISENEQTKAVRDYSGGMRRRVAIARALAVDSNLIVLDEPFKGLDEKTREVCAECIKAYSKDKLVVLITHDRDECALMGIKNVIEI